MQKLAEYYKDARPDPESTVNPVKIDRQLTFDRLTNVHYSGTRHPEDQPSHLDRPRRHGLRDALPRGVRQSLHPLLSRERLRNGGRRRRHEEAADQRVELRALQDVRHHGSLPDHRLGAARRRRRAALRRDVDGSGNLAIGQFGRSEQASSRRLTSGQLRKAALIAAAATPLIRGPRRHLPLARRRPRALRIDRRVGQAADLRVLARPHPAGHALLEGPRHRRHHQPELRRRVDRAASSGGSATAPRAGRRRAAARARWCSCGATWRTAGPPRSRSTARAVRPASRSPAPCSSPARPAIRSCRFTSKRIASGRRRAGTARRSRSRSARVAVAIGEPIHVPDTDERHDRGEASGA